MFNKELENDIIKGIRANGGEDFEMLLLEEPPGIYVVPVLHEVNGKKHSYDLDIDGRICRVYNGGSRHTIAIYREIEAALADHDGGGFQLIRSEEPYCIEVVPLPEEMTRCVWSCTLEIDGKSYDVYLG